MCTVRRTPVKGARFNGRCTLWLQLRGFIADTTRQNTQGDCWRRFLTFGLGAPVNFALYWAYLLHYKGIGKRLVTLRDKLKFCCFDVAVRISARRLLIKRESHINGCCKYESEDKRLGDGKWELSYLLTLATSPPWSGRAVACDIPLKMDRIGKKQCTHSAFAKSRSRWRAPKDKQCTW